MTVIETVAAAEVLPLESVTVAVKVIVPELFKKSSSESRRCARVSTTADAVGFYGRAIASGSTIDCKRSL